MGLPGPSGELKATVIDADVNESTAFRVRLEDGTEELISYARLADLLRDEEEEEEEEVDDVEDEEPKTLWFAWEGLSDTLRDLDLHVMKQMLSP